MPEDTEPTFNLKAVLNETRLKADTIRAWERRYGLPKPSRSRGRHRLYSERDIEAVKWLIARQAEGLSISRAVELWRHLEQAGHDPLHNLEYALPRPPGRTVGFVRGEALFDLRRSWIEACLAFDETVAESALNQAFALYPVESVCEEVLIRGLSEIGEAWYRSNASVQQEHFASALAVRRLEALMASAPPPSRPGRILVSCPPDEIHVFPPLLIGVMLRRRGLDVVYLGANVPLEQIEDTLTSVRPGLVILAAQTLHTAATLLETAQILSRAGVPMAYGGRIFNLIESLRPKVPGSFLGESLSDVVAAAEGLLNNPPSIEIPPAISRAHHKALTHFGQTRSLIEVEVLLATRKLPAPTENILDANLHLGNNIRAALLFGDIALLGYDLAWVEGLLNLRGRAAGHLPAYLRAYLKSIQEQMGDAGKPISDWLARVLAQRADVAREG